MYMDEDQWTYDYTMSQEVHMDYDNEEECGVDQPHVDCSNAFNTCQVFGTRDNVLQWAQTVAHEKGFVAVIMRSDIDTGSRGRSSFVLIGCERSGLHKCRNNEFVRRDTWSKKCGCPFRLREKPVHGREGWMVKLICRIHNHELAKSLVGHPYSMVKPKNILLMLKEHKVNNCLTIKQIYNARSAYRSSIRGANTEMQHLMKLLEHDQYIHWHRLKDEVVVRDLFWCHPLLEFVGVKPTMMTFSAALAYLEGERVNNIVRASERFRDLALMNAVKIVFPECTNLLCRFHIDKNVKAKCKSLISQKNAWDYVMDNSGTLVDCLSEQFAESLHKVESTHWALKRLLQNSLGDLCSVWDAMNNMITLQYIEIKASFETSTHVVGHVFKKTLYKRLIGMVSRNTLNEIVVEVEHLRYLDNDPSSSDQGLCEAEVSIKEEVETIYKRFEELDVYGKVTLKNIAYPDQNSMCPPPSKVNTKGAPTKPMKRNQRSTKRDPSYWEYVDAFHSVESSNSSVKHSASSSEPSKPTRIIPIWSHDYTNLFGAIERFEQLRLSLLVDGFSKVSKDKWMDITEMGYVIASRYNIILVLLSPQQSMTFFPLRSQPPPGSSVHHMICVGHVFGNHFIQWPTPYISRMQQYTSLMSFKRDYVDLNED
ncbi:hypothetical protein HKD37_12G033745 [Glycine soja]